jgi:hypothetical protein
MSHQCPALRYFLKKTEFFFFSHVGIEFSLPLIEENGHKKKEYGTSLGPGEYVVKIILYIF